MLEPHLNARMRVQVVPQRIAEEVEAQHGQRHGESREEHEMGRVEEVGARVVEHRAPAWRGSGDAEPEERQRGFGEDDSAHADRGLDEQRLHHVGQDVAEEDARAAGSEGAGGFHVFALFDGEDLRADEARVAGPASDCEGEDEVLEAGAEEGGEGDGEQYAGEGQERIHSEDGEDVVDPAAFVAGEATDCEAERERDADYRDGDGEGEARSPEEARQGVAAQLVGAAPVVGGGALQAMQEVDGCRVGRG